MLAYVKTDRNDKNRQAYLCAWCGIFITDSGQLFKVNGADSHSFVNPSGVQCNFRTFHHCENVLIHHDLYFEHSWFSGFGWRFLMCARCLQHLGWKYDKGNEPMDMHGFFGVLQEAVEAVSADDGT